MPLPTSRDLTINPTDPIPSSLLNKLQDCVVGMKQPAHPIELGGGAFVSLTPSTTVFNDGLWTFSGAALLYAPLRLPSGTAITSIVWAYNRGGAGALTLKLMKRGILTNVSSAVDTTTVNAGTGYTSQTKNPAYVVEPNFETFLLADCNNAANQFGGAIVTVSRL